MRLCASSFEVTVHRPTYGRDNNKTSFKVTQIFSSCHLGPNGMSINPPHRSQDLNWLLVIKYHAVNLYLEHILYIQYILMYKFIVLASYKVYRVYSVKIILY